MAKVAVFEVDFSNPEHVYFAGQELSGKVVLQLDEPKNVDELLLELKGGARTYWTKDSGKSRRHCSDSEPYFCEQFNTEYTHKFGDGDEMKRVLPKGRHEVPFSYTLSKLLPSSFEGEFGFIRYTCKAICEQMGEFDMATKTTFTVVGIEDINSISKFSEPVSSCDSIDRLRFCCRKRESISIELTVDRTGYTPGELIHLSANILNCSQKCLHYSSIRLRQHVLFRAKTFAGNEQCKESNKVVVRKERGEIAARSSFSWADETIVLPSVPPKLGRCRIIDVSYSLELEVDTCLTVSIPITVGTIPLLDETRLRCQIKHQTKNTTFPTIDESGLLTDDEITKRKRVRIPSSILSELYPELITPFFRPSFFGPIESIDDREDRSTIGEKLFVPKYPFYDD